MSSKPESTKQSMNNNAKLRKEVEKINWWHKIDFGNGVITPGIDITPEKLHLKEFLVLQGISWF